MIDVDNSCINGYLERKNGGQYVGCLKIAGVDVSPIVGVMFAKGEKNYLWLRRQDLLEYNPTTQEYSTRKREPRWEAYLEKQLDGNATVAYKGEFPFMRWRFSIVGVWDKVLGREKNRINFFVERLPMERQDIINGISKRNIENQ